MKWQGARRRCRRSRRWSTFRRGRSGALRRAAARRRRRGRRRLRRRKTLERRRWRWRRYRLGRSGRARRRGLRRRRCSNTGPQLPELVDEVIELSTSVVLGGISDGKVARPGHLATVSVVDGKRVTKGDDRAPTSQCVALLGDRLRVHRLHDNHVGGVIALKNPESN